MKNNAKDLDPGGTSNSGEETDNAMEELNVTETPVVSGKIPIPAEDILTDEEIKKFVNWMLGKETDPPQIMQKLSLNIANKLNFAMAFLMTYNMKRAQSLMDFISVSERTVFDKAKIYTSSDAETVDLYKLANNRLESILEFIRKYVYQNKDFMEGFDSKADKLKQLLMSLPEDKIDTLTEKIEKGEI